MANERMDKLDESVHNLNLHITRLLSMVDKIVLKGKEHAHEEEYNGHEHNEGESSHSPHVWHTHPQPSQRHPKLDMHKFDSSHLSAWIAQMEQYFKLNRIFDDETQLMLGRMYLDNERWQWWEWQQRCTGPFMTWPKFTKALQDRFDQESSFLCCLTKLRQTGTVGEYITTFEALAFRTWDLSDGFYTECFISGLKEAIKAQVLLHHPPTWTEACKVACNVERALAAQYSHPNFSAKGHPALAHNTTQTLKVQKVSPVEMAERRKQGLCYYYDEKYSPGHKCKEPKFFQIDATYYSSTEEEPLLEEHEPLEEDNQQNNVSDEPVISLHALAGISSPQTLKIRGFIKHHPVVVLIDSGSTHNFIHQKVAEAVHCFVRAISNFQVQIADGGTMKCEGRCENVKLKMGDYQLKTHMFAIHMGGCDIVLGVDWLRTLGPITMDFQELYMSFKQNNYTHTLHGLQAGAPSIISSHRMEKLLKKGNHGVVAQFNAIQAVETKPPPIHPKMQHILNNHLPVFDKPQGLPPLRGEHDHNITLVLGAQPPNERPYRYPFTQKNEIEKIIKELLEANVIRPSISPYSSLVVMMLNKDWEWQMCPKFRALNNLTVKDKFPIPVVDDLLDELNGAQFFTKLDLRSGYHQIRMKEFDIPKTAFRTHEGHYEFLVMPFGLCNAPSTFQSLMNHILKPYLRKFVLFFFDDILIYSCTWAAHIQHVDLLLQLLHKHKLFIKMSKCSFGMAEVEYLGHIVGCEGVKVDPKKIQAMQEWPQPKTLKRLRGFLGLTGYCRNFVRNYGRIAKPFTQLLKKNSFFWNEEAQQAFTTLKNAICSTLVLALLDFTKSFVIECDASGTVDTWRPYLLGRHFQIRTDHHSLKYFLEQRQSSPQQNKWLAKMLGYDYEIIYKKGKDNRVADALSRQFEEESTLLSISLAIPEWIEEACREWFSHPGLLTHFSIAGRSKFHQGLLVAG
eukprot:PITA_05714